MNTRRSIIAKQRNIMAPANTRRRLTLRIPRTGTICTRGITQLKQQSVTSSCTGISRPQYCSRKALRAIVRGAFCFVADSHLQCQDLLCEESVVFQKFRRAIPADRPVSSLCGLRWITLEIVGIITGRPHIMVGFIHTVVVFVSVSGFTSHFLTVEQFT